MNTYAIDGHVTDMLGQPVSDVTVTRSGDLGGSVLTDSNGFYSFADNLAGGTYVLTPTREGCGFDPPQRTYLNLAADQHNQDFQANCGLLCYDFRTDPNLQQYANEDGSISTYLCLPGWVAMPEGGSFATEFFVDAAQAGTPGHSAVMGPRTCEAADFADLRLNLHYDQADGPFFSLSAPGDLGDRTPLPTGHYRAVVTRGGNTATVVLTNLDSPGTPFTDTVDYVWEPFNAFLLCYDYYGGGYCQWDGSEMVAFKSDRGANFVEGRIDYLCLPEVNTYAIDGHVTDMLGQPMGHVRIVRTGEYGGVAFTDSTGFYEFPDNMLGGDFTLTPVVAGCTFSPSERTYENLTEAAHDQDFTFTLGQQCTDYTTDPGLHQYVSPENSVSTYDCFGSPASLPDGLSLVVDFCVTAASCGSPGHSSVMGPMNCGSSEFVDLRLNLHYDQAGGPFFSLSAPGDLGQRAPITVGSFRAVVTKAGSTATVVLTNPTTQDTLLTDTVDYAWEPFDAFLLSYDYYGGGYCEWDSTGAVQFRSDRGSYFIEGCVEGICVVYPPSDVEPDLPAPSDLMLRAMLQSSAGAPNSLSYVLPHEGIASLDIYDINGRHVANLLRGMQRAGVFQDRWTGTFESGARAPAGLYFAVLRLDRERVSAKLLRW